VVNSILGEKDRRKVKATYDSISPTTKSMYSKILGIDNDGVTHTLSQAEMDSRTAKKSVTNSKEVKRFSSDDLKAIYEHELGIFNKNYNMKRRGKRVYHPNFMTAINVNIQVSLDTELKQYASNPVVVRNVISGKGSTFSTLKAFLNTQLGTRGDYKERNFLSCVKESINEIMEFARILKTGDREAMDQEVKRFIVGMNIQDRLQ
jgi:hypothetical protein